MRPIKCDFNHFSCTLEQEKQELSPKLPEDMQVVNDSRTAPVPSDPVSQMIDEVIPTCDDSWDSVKDSIILALSILVGVLFLLCVYLVTKILQLKKRPRYLMLYIKYLNHHHFSRKTSIAGHRCKIINL